ncbi:helix-turn-helix transcriptional regulator [Diaphorobacter sp. NR2-3-3-1]|nr:helix-turn-helix transcriptional regulator [Diaphorobacter caeni]
MEEFPVRSLQGLGQLVRSVRKSQKLAIDDAAGLMGVSPDSFSRLERGVGGVGSDRLLAIMDGLGLELVVRKKRPAQAIQPQGIRS